MQMTFHDRAPLEKVRRLADGRIAAVAKFARSGVQTYAGHEVGRPDLASVNVYRPESEVFDEAAMASFAHKAITLGHPAGAVTADNWSQHSVGWTEGKVARDGDFVEIPLMLADASAVKAYDSGEARELSGGYPPNVLNTVRTVTSPSPDFGDWFDYDDHLGEGLTFDPMRDGAALAAFERAHPNQGRGSRVGGSFERFHVHAGGVDRETIVTWPDRIGRPIKLTA